MNKILNLVGWIMLVVSSVMLVITGVSTADISKVVTLAAGAIAAIVALIKPLWNIIESIKKKGD